MIAWQISIRNSFQNLILKEDNGNIVKYLDEKINLFYINKELINVTKLYYSA